MLSEAREKTLSKLMTKILRHSPESFGIRLDGADGSCDAEELLQALRRLPDWSRLTLADIEQVVRNSDKQRFELAEGRIRARYGHSSLQPAYEEAEPPPVLYHGTNESVMGSIRREGLRPMGRSYVHLSAGKHFAVMAGRRRGNLVMLEVDTSEARRHGITFYYAGNEVWLAAAIPPVCLRQIADGEGGEHS
ncbi:RNA 2'-phosphotransferase [Paenibacillus filicis]|uniref:Probable RNA 2'-phosphotransferase n=1 Tax=Paenibacillus filicis TaxID=669464 RepID=A0ABU9DNH3_9BACL